MRSFSKHYSKGKKVLVKFKKREEILPMSKISQDNLQNNFLNFLTSKSIFITLQCYGGILRIFLKQTLVKCFSNILEAILHDNWNLPNDQQLLLLNHNLLTQKQLFHQGLLYFFSLKCSLNVAWVSWTVQRWGNTQRMFQEYCVSGGLMLQTNKLKRSRGTVVVVYLLWT